MIGTCLHLPDTPRVANPGTCQKEPSDYSEKMRLWAAHRRNSAKKKHNKRKKPANYRKNPQIKKMWSLRRVYGSKSGGVYEKDKKTGSNFFAQEPLLVLNCSLLLFATNSCCLIHAFETPKSPSFQRVFGNNLENRTTKK